MTFPLKSFGKLSWLLPAFVSGLAIATPQPNPKLSNVTILIVRHAEKPLEGTGLTPDGEARAKAYINYFTHLKIDGHPWKSTHLFAAADSTDSQRPRLTLTPLSQATKMPLDIRFGSKDVMEIAQDIQSHTYGKEVLICWRHGKIPALIAALGGDPTPLFPTGKWPDTTFDWVVEIPFDKAGNVKKVGVQLIHEKLMPGDK